MGVKAEKQQIVTDIATKLRESKSTVIVNYRGLNVAQVTDLRRELREAGVDFKVYKNTLARRATAESDLTVLDEYLVGPTAIAFSNEDVIAPAKVLANFSKSHDALTIKAGIIEGQFLEEAKIKEIAEIPSREGLLAMLLSVLQAPIRNFALITKALAEHKEKEAGGQDKAE